MKYLLRGTLVILVIVVAVWTWLLHTESGASFVWRNVEAAMDGSLRGELRQGSFSNGVEFEGLRLSTDSVDVSVRTLRATVDVDLVPLSIALSNVQILEVQIEPKPSDTGEDSPIDVEEVFDKLRLPLRIDLLDARIDQIDILGDGSEPLRISSVDVSAFWHNEIQIRELLVRRANDTVSVAGNIALFDPKTIELAVNATVQEISASGDLSGDSSVLNMPNLLLESDDIRSGGAVILRLENAMTVEAMLTLHHLDLAAFTTAWPASHPITGALNAEASLDGLSLTDSRIDISGSDATVTFDAAFDRATSTLSADIGWQKLKWPIDAEIAAVESSDGRVSVNGVFDAWNVSGSVAVGTKDMPDGRFVVDGGGDLDHAALEISEGNAFGGAVVGSGSYSWRDSQPWSADLKFETLQTATLFPEFPGDVSGQIQISGTQSPVSIDGSLQDVVGTIRGEPLTAAGSFAWSDSVAFADELVIAHGTSGMTLNGSADTKAGLMFEGHVDLGTYIEDAHGVADASGRISRFQQKPYLSLNLSSDEIQVGDLIASEVELLDSRQEDAMAGFILSVGNVAISSQDVTDIEVVASVRKAQQTIRMNGTSGGATIGFSLDGAFDDLLAAPSSPWRGHVTDFIVDLGDDHTLRLEDAAAIELSTTNIVLDGFCVADKISSQLCLDGRRAATGDADVAASLENIPLALLNHAITTELTFGQRISGPLEWHSRSSKGSTGEGTLVMSPGSVTNSESSEVILETGVAELAFRITDGDLLSGTVLMPLPGVGGIDGEFKVFELTDGITSEVGGRLNIQIIDIAFLAGFTELVDAASGSLRAELGLSGVVSGPLLTGLIEVDGGSLSYRPIGLQLDEVDLVGELTGDSAVELSGRFRAGEGYAEIISSADYSDIEQPGIRFKIRGDELTLIDVPDIQVTANPDVEIAYRKESVEINGSVLIPRARISPANLAEGRVLESEDVVIVAGQLPDETDGRPTGGPMEFDGTLRVDLGRDVVINLDIAEANLTGGATFDWQGDAIPMVNGRYDLKGDVQVFGQVLDITEGGILFANTAANNPYLRIRAEREIYGNSQVKRAGVLVDGAATSPTIEAYTDPVTTEERALTLLVTGSDFDYEQGIGAVDFGTYIAPRLFVSYGVGVFDRENIISARYDLTKGFGVKATSGDKDSGIDLNYRFEN